MNPDLIRAEGDFADGYNPITEVGEARRDTGMAFGILRLPPGQSYPLKRGRECALLLLAGEIRVTIDDGPTFRAARRSLFDERPSVVHVPDQCALCVTADARSELALIATPNDTPFEPRCFAPSDLVEVDHRGRGSLADAAYRIVRTVFDTRNRPEANLVVGEVITFPGRWSSYPPHHHPHPELYHYRFTEPQGYGHSELGDAVVKVRHGDTVKILDEADHAQVAAPGYGMYYLWAIRHLPGRPYRVPETAAEHRWLLEPGATMWRPHKEST